MFNKIIDRIAALNLLDENEIDIHNRLGNQLHRAANSFYTKEELSDIIFSDDDVLSAQDIIKEDSKKWLAIRDIQHDIVNFFGDFDQSQI
jgi:hypothetical protein